MIMFNGLIIKEFMGHLGYLSPSEYKKEHLEKIVLFKVDIPD